MISLNGLTVKFGSHAVLNNLIADFEEGLIHGIVGLNGAGKTTFFNTLSCIQQLDSGTMAFQSQPISYHKIGYLESNSFFYSRITGNEYLKLFSATNTQYDIQKLNELTRVPLDNLIETYSSGMKKKLALLALIKEDKPIYLLDEPFNNLDIESCKILELIVMHLKEKGKTVFISSHIMDTLLPICDCIHLLEAGEFKKRFDKNEFANIEEELLGKFVESAKGIIGGAM